MRGTSSNRQSSDASQSRYSLLAQLDNLFPSSRNTLILFLIM